MITKVWAVEECVDKEIIAFMNDGTEEVLTLTKVGRDHIKGYTCMEETVKLKFSEIHYVKLFE